MNELEKYLSPSFKENLTVNESVKMNLILLGKYELILQKNLMLNIFNIFYQ